MFCSSFVGSGSVLASGNALSADLILKNGSVYTVDENRSIAKAVAVKDGEIVYVGDNKGVEAFKGNDTKEIDLKGKMVIPGIIDTHSHMYAKSEELFWIDLNPSNTMKKYASDIKKFHKKNPNLEQLRGVGWDKSLIQKESESRKLAPKKLLDEVVSDLPVVMIDNDHHTIWVNSKALELAGIDKDTPNPQGGFIERDPVTGEPTGIIREFTAIALLVKGLPEPYFTVEQNKMGILAFQEMAAERGTTSVFIPLAGESPHETLLDALKELDKEGKLTLRYEIALWADETKGPEQIERFKKLRDGHQGKLYNANSIKIFADDEEYKSTWKQDHLEKVVAAADKEGFRVFVHAFGSGVNATLDAFEEAAGQNGTRDSRHVITHLPNPSDEEMKRLKELRVIPSPQPGSYWGVARMKSYFEMGIPVSSSSDFPVNEFWPMDGIQGGMIAKDEEGNLKPEENASLDQMITSYTLNGAHLMFRENETGSIEVGKKADLVVLEKNLFEVPVEEISDTKILMTFFEGQEVFHR
ncbi:hypothetical protein AEA09_11220 [Lysinibacillus contaminans]|uniref:Amidohydrolase 3 domain-containing protein n=1 Tax=Lysinibacillus contaminans TaxID=1293441 RepID=A0ABR5K4P0_9BACI|nr:hypothetical protein AEA09_11220 [Lysinibacillus contaminans]